MKKIFTLFIAAGMITLVQAQPGNRDNRQPDRRDNPSDQRDNQPIDQRGQNNRYGDRRDVVVNHNPYNNNDDRYNNNDDRFDNNDDRFDNNDDRFDNNDDRFDNNDFRYGSSRFANERRMKMQIAQINREFDYKVEKLRSSFFFSRWEKQRQFRSFEEQRQREIRMVYFKFNGKGNKYNEHDKCDRPY